MPQETNKRTIVGALVIAALLAICAFFAGNAYGRNAADARYQAERDLNISLNRSELEGLGEIEGPIYVTGHKSPDSDTVCSSIGYARLLQELGYDARPVVLGDINNETKFILDRAGVEVPELLVDASGLNMVLVDHSEFNQSAEGLKDANVISIIDHHSDGSVSTGNRLIYDARPLGATATIVWIRYRNYGVELDSQTALLLFGAVLSDTNGMKSQTTTPADLEAIKTLGAMAGITESADVDAFYQQMFLASLSYEGMSDEDILFSDFKEYEAGGKKFGIGCVDAYDRETAGDLAGRMAVVAPQAIESLDLDYVFVQISIFHDDISVVYLVPADEASKEVLEAAFGDRATYDGASFICEPGFSRKSVTVPEISEVLEAHPTE